MQPLSDKTLRRILIIFLIAVIIILSLFAYTVYAFSSSGIMLGGRFSLVIPTPSNLGSPPWVCPGGTPCPPPGDLQLRLIGPENSVHTLADIQIYGPKSASNYTSILIPKSSRYCSAPRAGAFFIEQGMPVGLGGNALLMQVIGCSR